MNDNGLPAASRSVPAGTLFGARVVYAFNWYNVGVVLPLSQSFAQGSAALGIVLGAFLAGVGIFQIPAGFAALRWGARRVSIMGLLLMGLACVASGFSPALGWLTATRFVAGVGAAFFFSPGLSLVASYYPAGQRGPAIGLYNGGFSLGGAIGLVGGAYLGEALGSQWALTIGGVGLVVAGLVTWALLPDLAARTSPTTIREVWLAGRGVVRSRSIWALALALTGFWGAVFVVAQFFFQYGQLAHPEWGSLVTAALAAAVVAVSFPGGPVGGWLAERRVDRRVLIGLFGLLASGLVLAIPFSGLPAIWIVMIALGFVDGLIFAILYVIPAYLPESQGTGLSLGVAVVNSIQVLLGSAIAVAFGFIAGGGGFLIAWIFAAVLSFALLPLLFLVRLGPEVRGEPLAGGALAAAQGPTPR